MKKIFLYSLFLVSFALAAPLAARAAGDGCDNIEKNDYINSSLALCNTHAYNIGKTSNELDPNARAVMNEAIALKSTIIAQQMKQQYDFLDTTIKRLRTQMKKAILTASMEAAGAPSSDSGEGSSSNKSKYLNCMTQQGLTNTIACVQQNISQITQELSGKNNSGSLSNAIRKQLETDYKNLKPFKPEGNTTKTSDGPKKDSECESINKGSSKIENAHNCMQELKGLIHTLENEEKKLNQPYRPY
jgi:hypothetical protein